MTDKNYQNLHQFAMNNGGYYPVNDIARDFAQNRENGEITLFKTVGGRDIVYLNFYFAFLAFCYAYTPNSFKKIFKKENFYIFLKYFAGNYKIIYTFDDGTKWVELLSISFSKMDDLQFKDFMRLQIPDIYRLLNLFYKGEIYKNIIETIEQEFERKLSQLFSIKK